MNIKDERVAMYIYSYSFETIRELYLIISIENIKINLNAIYEANAIINFKKMAK